MCIRDSIASLACVRLTGWPVACNWRRTVLSADAVLLVFFSDERICTIAAPVNLQNDRVYAVEGVTKRDIPAKRLLRTRPTFGKSLTMSVAVSKLGCTELIFVEPDGKVDRA